MPFLYQVKVFWPRVETRPAYCIFLPFGTTDSGSKFRRNQVLITELPLEWRKETGCQNERGIFEGVTTSFIFIIIPFKYALLTKCKVVNMIGYMAKFLLRDLMHWCSLRSLLRTYQRSTCSKSSIREFKIRRLRTTNYGWTSVVLCL